MKIVYEKYDAMKWLKTQPLPLTAKLIKQLLPFNVPEKKLKSWLSQLVGEGLVLRSTYSIPRPSVGRTVLYGTGSQFQDFCERIQQDEEFLRRHCDRNY